MPVTAKLSREFYERFGDRVADEFVNWFNQVDATYRSEFKDLFEANFSRLEAELDQRLTAFEARVEQRLAQIEAKVEQRLAQIESRVAQIEARVEQRFAELRADLERRLSDQTRWLFAAWAVVLASVIGLYLRR
ncbi:MAG TPA: coiled-coil domain-containing protein [Gemmatimonadaceae bacterium]